MGVLEKNNILTVIDDCIRILMCPEDADFYRTRLTAAELESVRDVLSGCQIYYPKHGYKNRNIH